MKTINKIKLKKIESKLFISNRAKPLCIIYRTFQDLLVIVSINVKIKELFKWNGRLLWLPDNGRRKIDKRNFVLTKKYLKSHCVVAEILQQKAIETEKKLVLNFDYSIFDYEK